MNTKDKNGLLLKKVIESYRKQKNDENELMEDFAKGIYLKERNKSNINN